jgi:hypothetical protein
VAELGYHIPVILVTLKSRFESARSPPNQSFGGVEKEELMISGGKRRQLRSIMSLVIGGDLLKIVVQFSGIHHHL